MTFEDAPNAIMVAETIFVDGKVATGFKFTLDSQEILHQISKVIRHADSYAHLRMHSFTASRRER